MEILSNKIKSVGLALLLVGISSSSFAQKARFKEKKIARNLDKHIRYLASDELEGRGTGSAGEQLSAKYVAEQFEKIGLSPDSKNGYYQYMDIPTLRIAQTNCNLMIGKEALTLFSDYYPLSPSSNNGSYIGVAINVNYG
ncbi:MAG: hypothetical protein KJP21_04145, partial [Bacteroidia bacterium]|nr:hypothetical protein [Bacteroidia bacterium]